MPAAGRNVASTATLATGALLLVLAGIAYNALLAFLMARGLPITRTMVGFTEFFVLGAAALTLLRSGFRQDDAPALLLMAFFVLNAVAVSLINGAAFLDMGRNAAVIGIFLMLGLRVGEQTLKRTFLVAAVAVAAVLLLESVSVISYATVFEPGRYFEETRGISRFELDEIGLFANALGFDNRFSILNIVGHRTSSLFLEQVSLANFASVLTIYLVAMWKRLSVPVRIFLPLLIAGILVTNNSRTALAIALAAPLVYLVAPKLPRLLTLGLVPLILAIALAVTLTAPPTTEDNLVGRLSLTIRTLQDLDIQALVGARAAESIEFLDSGYTFVIYASSILGMIVLWLFFSLVPTGRGAALQRAGMMTGLYLFLNLTVSGTSIFSIKTAALLWFLIGFLRREEETVEQAPAAQPRFERIG
ncbi:hypothetical protein [Sphingomonas sp. LHG3406-1]|uniref:hypothetical protein n=1 Tax=Sphingomonas sp. LHG3406-1 TaxID=2804617 RepID=UPI00261D5A8D|nr:hypothetical protein [Sphingomonas sp. LHG3406-1]